MSGTNSHSTRYEVGCQSVFDGERRCPDSSFTKSTWHIFQTDNKVDYLRFELEEDPFNTNDPSTRTFGYVLYEGDARLDSTGLPLISSCDTLQQSGANQFGAVTYPCQLKPNTTYSIQLLFPTDYFGRIETRLYELGVGQTMGADPGNLPATHNHGPLSLGNPFVLTDTFSCEALVADHPCGNLTPDSLYAGSRAYDLGWWATFSLSNTGTIDISMSAPGQPSPMIQLFQGDVNNGCNLTQIDSFYSYKRSTACLQAHTVC